MIKKSLPNNGALKAALVRLSQAIEHDTQLILDVYDRAIEGIVWIPVESVNPRNLETLALDNESLMIHDGAVLDGPTGLLKVKFTESPEGIPAYLAFSDLEELELHCPDADGIAIPAREIMEQIATRSFDGVVINAASEWIHISVSHLQAVLDIGRTSEERQLLRGVMFCELGSIRAGIQELEEAIELNPENSTAHYNLALAKFEIGDIEEGKREFQRSGVEAREDIDKMRRYLGCLYIHQMIDDALPLAKKLNQLDPENPGSLALYGAICDAKGLHDDAIEAFERALSIDPESPVLLTNLGIAYMGKNNLDKARDSLETSRDLDESYGLTHYNLACLHARLDEARQAIEALEEAIRFDPNCLSLAQQDADFDELRELEEFRSIVVTH